ncbi:hypothetical protein [Polyangium jinanense]|uniref:Uncharacterized protein n=1 Tax=Polyangium jinanense TaxID=2829994 RepID=A0A9X3XB21_9BACT|nr:hypothetical protein [Polyangium jinanense]MDC3956683.1 hypothetical protein [Polyangium jinanense]MDC3984746.1 hypothetical protein [Polyangium jinanense]
MTLSYFGRTLAGLVLTGTLGLLGCKGTVVIGGGGEDGQPGQPGPGDPGGVVNPPPVCGSELHLIGIYESHGNHGGGVHPPGAASVHVERQSSSILVLSSYEPVHWTVTAAEGVTLEKVILNGYHDQTADVPAGVAVEIHDGPDGSLGAYGYAWPHAEGGSDTQTLVAAVENLTGRALTSFHGCYQATHFTLHDDLQADSSCAIEQGYTQTSHVAEGMLECDDEPEGADSCAGKEAPGVYDFKFCWDQGGSMHTPDSSCEEALDNCLLNSPLNPDRSVICRFDGEVVHLREVVPGDCDGF